MINEFSKANTVIVDLNQTINKDSKGAAGLIDGFYELKNGEKVVSVNIYIEGDKTIIDNWSINEGDSSIYVFTFTSKIAPFIAKYLNTFLNNYAKDSNYETRINLKTLDKVIKEVLKQFGPNFSSKFNSRKINKSLLDEIEFKHLDSLEYVYVTFDSLGKGLIDNTYPKKSIHILKGTTLRDVNKIYRPILLPFSDSYVCIRFHNRSKFKSCNSVINEDVTLYAEYIEIGYGRITVYDPFMEEWIM